MYRKAPEMFDWIDRKLIMVMDSLCGATDCDGECSKCIFDASPEEFEKWLSENINKP